MANKLLKLVYPNSELTKGDLKEILKLALEMRHRIKEQPKKLGDMEFYDINFSYIQKDSSEKCYVSVPKQGGGKCAQRNMQPLSSPYGFTGEIRHDRCVPSEIPDATLQRKV